MPPLPTNDPEEILAEARKSWERGPSTESYLDHNDMWMFKVWKPRSYDIYGTRFTADAFDDLVRQLREAYPHIKFEHDDN